MSPIGKLSIKKMLSSDSDFNPAQLHIFFYGKKLLKFCEQAAMKRNINNLFILTTQSEHWFIENNFVLGDKENMPEERKKTYTSERNSKYFTKRL